MKKLITLLLTGVMAFSLCSCGDNSNERSVVDETVSNGDVSKTEEKEVQLTQIAAGDTISLDFAEMTIEECGIKDDIRTSIKTDNSTYISGPQAVEGSKFIYMRGKIKSLSKEEISNINIEGNAVIDGYSYNIGSINIIKTNGQSTYSLAPLTLYTYTIYAQIPDELANNHQSAVLNIGFNDQFASDNQITLGEEKELSDYQYAYTLTVQ